MSSEIEGATGEACVQETRSPGASLQQARERHGWSVAEVAEKLHLTESAVCSLEAERYDELPGATFVRGYIRTYAKLVGLDQDALVKQYSQGVQPIEVEPIRALPDLGRRVARSRSRGRLVMALLLLAVLAGLVGGYFWWQDGQQKAQVALQVNEEVAFSQVEIERVDGTLYIQSLDDLDARTAELEVAEISLDFLQLPLMATGQAAEANAVEPESDASSSIDGLDAELVAATEGSEGATAPDTDTVDSSGAAVTAKHRLELSFTAECWIRITDGTGTEVASGLYQAGQVVQLSGETPFELHLGNAGGVQLRFNEQPVDISSSIRGNVARIKLG